MKRAVHQFFPVDALGIACGAYETEGIAHLKVLLLAEMLTGLHVEELLGGKVMVEILLPHFVETGCRCNDQLRRIVGRRS